MPITDMNFAEYRIAIKVYKVMRNNQSPIQIDINEEHDEFLSYIATRITDLFTSGRGKKVFRDRTKKQRFSDIIVRILIEKKLLSISNNATGYLVMLSSRCIDLIHKTKKELRLYQINFVSIIITLVALLTSIIFNILVLNK